MSWKEFLTGGFLSDDVDTDDPVAVVNAFYEVLSGGDEPLADKILHPDSPWRPSVESSVSLDFGEGTRPAVELDTVEITAENVDEERVRAQFDGVAPVDGEFVAELAEMENVIIAVSGGFELGESGKEFDDEYLLVYDEEWQLVA